MDIWALQLHSMVKEAPIEECKKVLEKMQISQAIEYLKNKYSELRKENIEFLKEAFPEKSLDFINKALDESNNDINKALQKFYNNPESLEQNIKSGAIPKNTHGVHMRKRSSSNSLSKSNKANSTTDTSNNDTKKNFLLLNASTKNKTKTNSTTSSNNNDNKNSHLSSTSIQHKTNQKTSSNDNTDKNLLSLSSSIKNKAKTKANPPTSSNDSNSNKTNKPLFEKLKPKPWIISHDPIVFQTPSQKVSQSTLLPRMEIPQNKIESEWNKSNKSPFFRANNNANNPIFVDNQSEYEYSDYSQYDYLEADDNSYQYDYDEEDQNNNNDDQGDFESQPRDNHLKTETIDLHGLLSKQARFIVEASLSQAKKNRIGVFRFITGVGNHSTNNVPILRPLVLEICKKYNFYAYIPEKNQGFVVCNVCKPFQ